MVGRSKVKGEAATTNYEAIWSDFDNLAHKEMPVFDRGCPTINPYARIGLNAAAGGRETTSPIRRTELDRRPPRSVVTAQLMGDPPATVRAEKLRFTAPKLST